jgi:hypothetical protein
MHPTIVLIPSPLNGPLMWAPVSRALQARGVATLIADLQDDPESPAPYWVQHAASVARELGRLQPATEIILAGHSGTGPLLPAIGAFSPHPLAGYLFVDAGLPIPGQSRLEEFEDTLPELGTELRQQLEAGGRYPEWTDEDAREILPDEGLRRGILAELRPRGLRFFTEPFPRFGGWPDAPCGYIRFSSAYDQPAAQARSLGWAYREFDAGHFHMAVAPDAVADVVLSIAEGWRESA